MSRDVQVVITSCGLTTSIGNGVEDCWKNLLSGVSGITDTARFDLTKYPAKNSCLILEFPESLIDVDYPLDHASRLLMHAVQEAVSPISSPLEDVPVYLASTLGGMESGSFFYKDYLNRGLTEDNRRYLKDYLPFMPGRHLQELFGFRYTPQCVTNACSSGANAIGLALMAIRSGQSKMAIAAGFDVLSEFVFGGFSTLRLIAPDCCRPFDLERKGLVLGEGAGVLVLEEEQSARAAGRPILARITGYASLSEAYHVTKPHPKGEGAAEVLTKCIADAGLRVEDISAVNAHGTGTVQNDLMEARAIQSVFGDQCVPIVANKGAVGHTLGAAGAVEAVFSVLSLRDQVLPPTVNVSDSIPELGASDVVKHQPMHGDFEHIISASYGFGGTNAALIFSKVSST